LRDPAILGAAVMTRPVLAATPPAAAPPPRVGRAAAGISGVAAIWLFVRLLRTQGFHAFAYYTWAVGALFLGWLAL
jgi:undecaprenyl pyrophosphate phosphatase UppP